MPRHNDELVEIDADFVGETADAWCIRPADREEVWVPKSQVTRVSSGVWSMPEWLAEDRDLL